ncbi:MAG: hypothetical protein ACFE0J_07380, partial [Elainellaceae cyanobacterium]
MKKKIIGVALGTISIFGLLFSALVVQAGGWENFKLRYYSLTKYFHNQDQELNDIRKQNLNPDEQTRIDLDQLL